MEVLLLIIAIKHNSKHNSKQDANLY